LQRGKSFTAAALSNPLGMSKREAGEGGGGTSLTSFEVSDVELREALQQWYCRYRTGIPDQKAVN
jgi:hypothetical protein